MALYGGGIYALMNLFALLFSNRMIFAPQPSTYTTLDHEVRIKTGGGETINAVYRNHPQAKYTLLFSHGNAEDLGKVTGFMEKLYRLGFSVLMYDYRGYGTSEGSPSVTKAKQDVEAAYRWLVEEKQIDPKSIISQGRSLGGGPATWLAAKHEVGGLVIESTFVSTFRVKTRWPLVPWDKFNNLRSIKKTRCPVLVIHGRKDNTLPFWHGQKLYEAAPGKKMHLWIDDGTHYDYANVAGDDYLNAFGPFVELVEEYQSTSAE